MEKQMMTSRDLLKDMTKLIEDNEKLRQEVALLRDFLSAKTEKFSLACEVILATREFWDKLKDETIDDPILHAKVMKAFQHSIKLERAVKAYESYTISKEYQQVACRC